MIMIISEKEKAPVFNRGFITKANQPCLCITT